MPLFRISLSGLAPVLALIAWWAAERAATTRQTATEDLTIMLPGSVPVLNPFWQNNEIDRQIVDLLHAPLLRIGSDGTLLPTLASSWDWSQKVTCWFANADQAAAAAAHLKALNADRWIALQLDEVTAQGTELVMRFGEPTPAGPDATLQEIAPFEPLPIDFLRITVTNQIRSYHSHYVENAVERSHLRRTWFDGDRLAELVISGTPGDAAAELRQYYENRPELGGRLTMLGRVNALREYVLEFQLRDDIRWPDTTPFTASDVIATVEYVAATSWPIPNRESFRQIQFLEAPATHRLRITYRQFIGAALCGWVHFPILPQSWLETHPADDQGSIFTETAPGAGPYQVRARRSNTLVLDPRNQSNAAPQRRLRFQSGTSDFVTQIGFATEKIDLFWPPLSRIKLLSANDAVTVASAPPHSRLLVVWNTRQGPLQNPVVRTALANATDRQALIDELAHGAGGLYSGVFKPGLWFSQNPQGTSYDPAKADALLSEAGWLKDVTTGLRKNPDGPLQIHLLTASGQTERERLAHALAQQWQKIGIETIVETVPWEAMLDTRLMPREFDAALLGLDFELTWDQLPFWHSSQSAPGGLNFSGLQDRQLDLLLETLRLTYDPEAVPALVEKTEARIHDLHPTLPLFTDLQPAILRNSVVTALTPPDRPLTLRSLVTSTVSPPSPPPTPVMREPAIEPPPPVPTATEEATQ